MKRTNLIIKKVVITIVLCFIISLILLSFIHNPLESKVNEKKVKTSGGGFHNFTLNYRDFKEIQFTVSKYYGIDWSFTSYNEHIGIKVIAMDFLNYKNFLLNNTNIVYHILSNGEKSHDKGCFGIPHEDTWFFIFLNDDPDQESTRIDIDWEFNSNPVLFIFTPLIIFVSIISLYLILYFILKKKEKKLPRWTLILLFIIIFSSIIYAIIGYSNVIVFIIENPVYLISSSSPINIEYNEDFERYQIPGSGTIEDPYRIENRTICTSTGYAIWISHVSEYFVIQNNFLSGSIGAIRLDSIYSGFIKIINNTCIGTLYNTRGWGIEIYNNYGNFTIKNNKLINYDYALILGSSPHSSIQNNMFLHNSLNLYLYSSNSTQILNNVFIFKEGHSWSKDCIYIDSSYNCSIKNNILEGSGLYFSNYLGNSLTCENNLVNNKLLGFYTDLDGVVIDNPDIYGQLFFINCSDIVIKNQNIENTNYALTFINCSICNCDYSNFSNNHNTGIRIIDSNDFNVSNCKFSFNSKGAYIYYSNSTIFLDNIFNNNLIGIHIYYSKCDYLNNIYYNNTENWKIDQEG